MNFKVTGLFYTKQIETTNESLRSILEIKDGNEKINNPQLIVVMMNPGKSSPLDGKSIYSTSTLPIGSNLPEAMPDRTQVQIMRLMKLLGIKYSRILNLSDLRNPKSKEFYKKIDTYRNDDTHSIFSEQRTSELNSLLGMEDIPVLAAWGLSKNLLPLASLAIERLKGRKLFGIKPGEMPLFRHPLPRMHQLQTAWLDEIFQQIIADKGSQPP